nr:MAG TPA: NONSTRUCTURAL PROTEIN 1 PROTEIN, RNA-BINDING, SSRNA-BINDING, DSRNA-BINDING [Caudoviricetes sp.]
MSFPKFVLYLDIRSDDCFLWNVLYPLLYFLTLH